MRQLVYHMKTWAHPSTQHVRFSKDHQSQHLIHTLVVAFILSFIKFILIAVFWIDLDGIGESVWMNDICIFSWCLGCDCLILYSWRVLENSRSLTICVFVMGCGAVVLDKWGNHCVEDWGLDFHLIFWSKVVLLQKATLYAHKSYNHFTKNKYFVNVFSQDCGRDQHKTQP